MQKFSWSWLKSWPWWLLVAVGILIGLMIYLCCDQPWNDPYRSSDEHPNTFYSVFSERPKTLDPARSYESGEAVFTGQIYEPPLQYHYLIRPYTLVPLTAARMPDIYYLDKNGKRLGSKPPVEKVAYTVYDIQIKPGTYYQPHPAFAKQHNGQYRYHPLSPKQIEKYQTLSDFKHTDTRELTAQDYVYQIKRLASPHVQSPLYGLFVNIIDGFSDYSTRIKDALQQQEGGWVDLRRYPLPGVELVDKYRYKIILKGDYPQFKYWLAMPFFSPIPWEADKFYSQPGMKKNNLSFDWYPVGTGPYLLTENNPNRRMVMDKNPNFHEESYPTQGMAEDQHVGLLERAGQRLPFVDRFVFTLEKESIPLWNKFLQGYYDLTGVASDSYDEAIQADSEGNPVLTPAMQEKGIQLTTSVQPSLFYFAFNMLDPQVGGESEQNRKLRLAIAMALDFDEFTSLFLNGRGIAAHGPIPPGIFGYKDGEAGINPYVFEWQQGKAKKKSLAEAKQLLAEAGYPNGISQQTGEPLQLSYDVVGGGGPESRAQLHWMRKQFAKLGIQLHVRATQYNRFQDKVRNGHVQLFSWGWVADYPDPENFLFLLYGPNSRVKHGGENTSNYHNLAYDQLFEAMINIPNGSERQALIDKMIQIARHDSPLIWGYHGKTFQLAHAWNGPRKPLQMGRNSLKYITLDPKQRAEARWQWNQPKLWPLAVIALLLVLGIVPVAIRYWRKENSPPPKV